MVKGDWVMKQYIEIEMQNAQVKRISVPWEFERMYLNIKIEEDSPLSTSEDEEEKLIKAFKLLKDRRELLIVSNIHPAGPRDVVKITISDDVYLSQERPTEKDVFTICVFPFPEDWGSFGLALTKCIYTWG